MGERKKKKRKRKGGKMKNKLKDNTRNLDGLKTERQYMQKLEESY